LGLGLKGDIDSQAVTIRAKEYPAVVRVTAIGGVLDLLLGFIKVSVGLITHSHGLVADGVHSLSDLVTDVLVIVSARYASRVPDDEHPYGHRRIQTAATVLLAGSLILVGLGIAWDSFSRLGHDENALQLEYWALIVAGASALIKEGLYRYTIRSAKRFNSNLLKANAWHHRTDALSSLVVFVGVTGGVVGIDWADPLAAIVVAAMILHIGWKIGREGYEELIDTAVSSEIRADITRDMLQVSGVEAVHQLRTRKTGLMILADVHIRVDPKISVSEGHRIGDAVAQQFGHKFQGLSDVVVHIDSEDDDESQPSIGLPLRPSIEKSIALAFESFCATSQDELALSPIRIALHYVSGMLTAEIWLPLTNPKNCAFEDDIRRAVSKELKNIVRDFEITLLWKTTKN